jgi:two-component system LytT family response regulator
MKKDYIVVAISRNIKRKIFLSEINYIEADGSYTKLYFTDNSNIILSRLLKSFEFLSDKYNFFRVNRSYIINLDYCYEISKGKNHYVIMKNDKKINIYDKEYTLLLKKEFS